MNAPALNHDESVTPWVLPLTVVFVVSLGYGVVLPVLPFVLARAGVAVAWHTGLLTGVYMLALFLFAPLWGYVSDRIGRRTVILLGLAGFSAAMFRSGNGVGAGWLAVRACRGRVVLGDRQRSGGGHRARACPRPASVR